MDYVEGVTLTQLKTISNPKGEIKHALKAGEVDYCGFGEAYFSEVRYAEIKGWKKHSQMTLNIIVPLGQIRFVIYDDREDSRTKGIFSEVIIGVSSYHRLKIPPLVWVAFQGVSRDQNLLLNIANIEHDPIESENQALEKINYNWEI